MFCLLVLIEKLFVSSTSNDSVAFYNIRIGIEVLPVFVHIIMYVVPSLFVKSNLMITLFCHVWLYRLVEFLAIQFTVR